MACQLPGRPGVGGGMFAGLFRLAKEYSLESSLDNRPVFGSMRRILIPDQKLPKLSHACPRSSKTRFGSMALKSSSARDRKTSPRSTQRKFGLAGSSVLFVTRAIPEVFFPNSENA